VIAYELVHNAHKSKEPGSSILKLDYEKAYDSVLGVSL
jgi:hypothetical protein